ncbi:Arm DNA-binding domain-containing protein [Paucibacter sp. O1-1]|nr:Arm DNA-binding domain-containing protein [Paucibacter sp. O1-1]MDA3825090.1 Arm DNA-binding domain-containing protein [Paucibacter sp. O1-1]
MDKQQRPLTDRELKALLANGAIDRSVGEGLTFVASATAARNGKATWVLRFRLNNRAREKVLGRYPELSLKDAREQARQDRAQIEQGVDVATMKQAVKARLIEAATVQSPGEHWHARHIKPMYAGALETVLEWKNPVNQ